MAVTSSQAIAIRVGYRVSAQVLKLLDQEPWAACVKAGEITRTDQEGGLSFASVALWRDFITAAIAARTRRKMT